MLKNPTDLFMTRDEQGELLDRLRRVETRLVVLMNFLGVDANGKELEEKRDV